MVDPYQFNHSLFGLCYEMKYITSIAHSNKRKILLVDKEMKIQRGLVLLQQMWPQEAKA